MKEKKEERFLPHIKYWAGRHHFLQRNHYLVGKSSLSTSYRPQNNDYLSIHPTCSIISPIIYSKLGINFIYSWDIHATFCMVLVKCQFSLFILFYFLADTLLYQNKQNLHVCVAFHCQCQETKSLTFSFFKHENIPAPVASLLYLTAL